MFELVRANSHVGNSQSATPRKHTHTHTCLGVGGPVSKLSLQRLELGLAGPNALLVYTQAGLHVPQRALVLRSDSGAIRLRAPGILLGRLRSSAWDGIC
jgi:hypothetical protein